MVKKPKGAKGWNGSYLKKSDLPADPWGNDYLYRQLATGSFELLSYGADGMWADQVVRILKTEDPDIRSGVYF